MGTLRMTIVNMVAAVSILPSWNCLTGSPEPPCRKFHWSPKITVIWESPSYRKKPRRGPLMGGLTWAQTSSPPSPGTRHVSGNTSDNSSPKAFESPHLFKTFQLRSQTFWSRDRICEHNKIVVLYVTKFEAGYYTARDTYISLCVLISSPLGTWRILNKEEHKEIFNAKRNVQLVMVNNLDEESLFYFLNFFAF